MKSLNSDISTPLYQQLYDAIKDSIAMGEYKRGERIPSEDQLSQMHNISRITVRSALKHLVDENILIKKKGKGTYVATPVMVESTSASNSFTKSCLQINAVPSTQIVSITKEQVSKKIGGIFGLSGEDEIICVKRLRLINDIPAIFEVDYFYNTFTFLFEDEPKGIPILDYIWNKVKIRAGKVKSIFEVSHATKEQAIYLECEKSFPLLKINETVFDENGKVLYYNEQFIKSDTYKYATSSEIRSVS